MGITDILSRSPNAEPKQEKDFTEQFVICVLNSYNSTKNALLRDTAEKHALLTAELQKDTVDTVAVTKKAPKLRNYPARTKSHIPIEPYDAARDIIR